MRKKLQEALPLTMQGFPVCKQKAKQQEGTVDTKGEKVRMNPQVL